MAVRRNRDESTVSLGGTCAGGVVVSDSRSAGMLSRENSGLLRFAQQRPPLVRSLRASDQPSTMLVTEINALCPNDAPATRQPSMLRAKKKVCDQPKAVAMASLEVLRWRETLTQTCASLRQVLQWRCQRWVA